jgi:two-component system, cell cycle sensor histidine kinase and response regulator CckA
MEMRQTILVVDDEEMVLDLVYTVLSGAGYNVMRAGSGREAIALCQTYAGPIHLAILDVMMPVMSGPELCSCLHDHLPSVRNLFMSGYSQDKFAIHGVQVGPDDFLGKPFTIATLLGRVKEALAETQHRNGSP